jgi:enolase
VQKAVQNVHKLLAPKLLGMDITSQREIDRAMIAIDGTADKSKVGANGILAVSLAAANAAAKSLDRRCIATLAGSMRMCCPCL